MRTLVFLLETRKVRQNLGIRSLSRENDFFLRIESSLPVPGFREKLKEIISGASIEDILPDPGRVPLSLKFDALLPPRLLVKQYAAAMLDLEELGGQCKVGDNERRINSG
jgi:hypothetical protein